MVFYQTFSRKNNHSPLNEVARISAYFEIVVCERLEVQYQTWKKEKISFAIKIHFLSRGGNCLCIGCKLSIVETLCQSTACLKTLQTLPFPEGLSLSHTQRNTETETKELSERKTFSSIE